MRHLPHTERSSSNPKQYSVKTLKQLFKNDALLLNKKKITLKTFNDPKS